MPDASVAAPPAPGAGAATATKPVAAPAPAGVEQKAPTFEFKFEPGEKFTLDQMLLTNYVEAVIRFTQQLSATFRTTSANAIQAIEGAVDIAKQKDKTAKFVWNEMTIAQLYFAVFAINGKPLPPMGDFTNEKDDKRIYIRSLPGPLFDILVKGLNDFDKHCKQLVGGVSVKLF